MAAEGAEQAGVVGVVVVVAPRLHVDVGQQPRQQYRPDPYSHHIRHPQSDLAGSKTLVMVAANAALTSSCAGMLRDMDAGC